MKKVILCLVLSLSLSLSSHSQKVDHLLKKVSQTESTEKVKINGFMLSLGKMFGGTSNIPAVKGINSLEVYTISDNDFDLKKDFTELFNNSKNGGDYETLIFAKDKGEGIRILIKKKKDIIENMVLLCMDENEPTIIKLSGKIKEKDLEDLIDKYNK